LLRSSVWGARGTAFPPERKPPPVGVQVAGAWRRPTDRIRSRMLGLRPCRLRRALRSVLLRLAAFSCAVLPPSPRLRRTGEQDLRKKPAEMNPAVFCSGDVLLSHGLSPYYHRGCSLSLPCSEWERVGPLRYCHQSAEPHGRFAAFVATQARCRTLGTMSILRSTINGD
jgi:hypothetical protein